MTSFDASSTAAEFVPVEVLARLDEVLRRAQCTYLIVGAAARDLAVHGPSGERVQRATHDIDIAVAVRAGDEHSALLHQIGTPTSAAQRTRVLGVDVDVIPFSGDDHVVDLDGSRLDITGLAEAAARPVIVAVAPGLAVPVASIEAQAVLKILAWRDRGRTTSKDAEDLGQILRASSRGVYAELAWDDAAALAACEGDIVRMGPHRIGRAARLLLSSSAAARVVGVLDEGMTALVPSLRVTDARDMLLAFRDGFEA